MKIGVIGAGAIGKTLAWLARSKGHDVTIANSRGPKTLASLAEEIGVTAVTAHQAAMAEDMVVLAVPQKAVLDLSSDLFAVKADASVIVDTGNYYPKTRDGVIAEIESGMLDSEWVARRIGRPIVKAFNMITATDLATGGRESGVRGRIAIAVAGDELAAKACVSTLIDQIGFDPVDTGALSESWRQQPGTIGYCHGYDAIRLRAAMAATDPSRIAEYRQDSDAFGSELLKIFGSAAAVGAV
jgi:8-hydroxy-5-deazaflavin:NADPH oxidoreductase